MHRRPADNYGMLFLLLLNAMTLFGPFLAARSILGRRRNGAFGVVGLTLIFWFCSLSLSGVVTGLVVGRFTSLSFGTVAVSLSAFLSIFAHRWKPTALEKKTLPLTNKSPSRWELWPLLLIAAATMLWNLLALDLLPIRIWETLNYRGVMVGMWMQGEPLRGFESNSVAAFAYPGNTELLQLWMCIHPHCDRWIELPSWLAAIALADFVGMLAADISLPNSARWWAAALTLTIPVVAVQAATEQDDLTTAAAFVGGLIFVRRWLCDDAALATGHALAAGASLGFALGSKVVMIPFLVPVAIWILWTWQHSLRTWPAFAAPFAVVGLYFYADNLIRFGNPLYPFPVKLLGITLFAADEARGLPEFVPGFSNLITHLKNAPAEWFETHAATPGFTEATGFGGIWPAIILPACVIVAIERATRRSSESMKPSSGFWALAVVVVFGELLMWSNTLWTIYDLRYSIHLPALGTVPATICLYRCQPVWRGVVSVVAIALGAWTFGNIVGNNWNSPISRMFEFRKLPYEQRTYAALKTMPEAQLFATLEADGLRPEAKSVAMLTPPSALRAAAFGPTFQRTLWNPDQLKMQGDSAAGRWAREVEARKIDSVLVINLGGWRFGMSKEAEADLANPQRWTEVFNQSAPPLQLIGYRKVVPK